MIQNVYLILKTFQKLNLQIQQNKEVFYKFNFGSFYICKKQRKENIDKYNIEIIFKKETDVNIINVAPSIENPNYGSYYDSFQSIYFNNLCQFLYEKQYFDEAEFKDCETILNGKLKQGIVAFNQLYSSVTQDYVLNKESRFGQINLESIWQFNIAIDYIKSAFKVLLTSWSNDLGSLIDKDYTLILILLIVMVVFQFLVFVIVAEMYLVNQLKKKFQFYRQIYKSYMPNDIIQKEKIIRASLIKYNIIKR